MRPMYDVVTVFGAAHLPEVQRVLLHLEFMALPMNSPPCFLVIS